MAYWRVYIVMVKPEGENLYKPFVGGHGCIQTVTTNQAIAVGPHQKNSRIINVLPRELYPPIFFPMDGLEWPRMQVSIIR